jgi:flagellar basal body-associated protein FliL
LIAFLIDLAAPRRGDDLLVIIAVVVIVIALVTVVAVATGIFVFMRTRQSRVSARAIVNDGREQDSRSRLDLGSGSSNP